MKLLKESDFWIALFAIIATVFLAVAVIFDKPFFGMFMGRFSVSHWMTLFGGFWIATVTPAYYFLKNRNPARIRFWIRLHVFGNLFAFLLISAHFTYQITSVAFMGTGLALYIAVLSLVLTGLIQRFSSMLGIQKKLRFLHASLTTTFFLTLIIHVVGRFVRL